MFGGQTPELPFLRTAISSEQLKGCKAQMQTPSRPLVPVLSLVFNIIAVASIGCGRADSPQSLAEHAKALGVYVSSPDGLHDVSVFGVEEHNILAETMTFK